MVGARRVGWWVGGAAVFAGAIALLYYYAQPETPQQTANRLQKDLTAIRGLPFKRSVVVQVESTEDFRKSFDAQLKREMQHRQFDKVARMLGFLASGEVFDIEQAEKSSPLPPTGSFYDIESGCLSLLQTTVGRTPPRTEERDLAYARELYHALQDQYFDLRAYLTTNKPDGEINEDEWLARRAVVDGEANYAVVLWGVKRKLGHLPDHSQLYVLAKRQDIELSAETVRAFQNDPRMRNALGIKHPIDFGTPKASFINELGEGIARSGLAFVYDVHYSGWSAIAKLYKESPPVSTAQILHPRKWFNNERPVTIQYPPFETNKAFANWELLAHNVLGEFQWRVVFKSQHIAQLITSAPAGWNGDRYAVFKRRGGDDMLMLMYTVWETERDAQDFASTYRLAFDEKYTETKRPPLRMLEEGHRVVIVEGGDESSLDTFMKFAASAQEIEPAPASKI